MSSCGWSWWFKALRGRRATKLKWGHCENNVDQMRLTFATKGKVLPTWQKWHLQNVVIYENSTLLVINKKPKLVTLQNVLLTFNVRPLKGCWRLLNWILFCCVLTQVAVDANFCKKAKVAFIFQSTKALPSFQFLFLLLLALSIPKVDLPIM